MNPPNSEASHPDFDVAELLARVDNDRDLLRELLDIFKADSPRHLEALRDAVTRSDVSKVVSEAHTLKGMLSNLSARQASASAANLEQLAREGEAANFAASLAVFEKDMLHLMPEIEAYLSGASL